MRLFVTCIAALALCAGTAWTVQGFRSPAEPVAAPPADAHAGHDHGPGEGHEPAPQAPDDHAGHDHGPGEGHGSTAAADHPAKPAQGDKSATCAKHSLAKLECPFCDPALIESLGYCKGHDIAEALCWKCNPKLIAAYRIENDWCAGHDRPESRCLICNPGLAKSAGGGAPNGSKSAAGAPRPTASSDPARIPRSQRAPSPTCTTETQIVKLASEEIARQAGLSYAPVERRKISHSIQCPAQISYDAKRVYRYAPRVAGMLRELRCEPGRRVKPGDVLALVDSSDFAAVQANWLQASVASRVWEKTLERQKSLFSRGLSPETNVLETETKLAEAKIAATRAQHHLRTLGLSDAAMSEIVETGAIRTLFEVTATAEGVVTDCHLVIGENADASKPLVTVVDTSQMWALLDVPGSKVDEIQAGHSVALHLDDDEASDAVGVIDWVSTEIDARTRTLRARVNLPNPEGRLRSNQFGRAEISTIDHAPMLVVARDAIQWDGCCNIVFVRESGSTFRPRKVQLGHEHESLIEIEHGLESGQTVVAQGSFLLKTELMKSSIGAGCCPDDKK